MATPVTKLAAGSRDFVVEAGPERTFALSSALHCSNHQTCHCMLGAAFYVGPLTASGNHLLPTTIVGPPVAGTARVGSRSGGVIPMPNCPHSSPALRIGEHLSEHLADPVGAHRRWFRSLQLAGASLPSSFTPSGSPPASMLRRSSFARSRAAAVDHSGQRPSVIRRCRPAWR